MKKTLLYLCLLVVTQGLYAKDKDPAPEAQPTLEERFSLMTQQRDALVKEVNKLNAEKESVEAVTLINTSANEVARKYNCEGWRPDFTCVKKQDPKAVEKTAKEAAKVAEKAAKDGK